MTQERFQELLQYRKELSYLQTAQAYNGSYPGAVGNAEIIRRIDQKISKYLELE